MKGLAIGFCVAALAIGCGDNNGAGGGGGGTSNGSTNGSETGDPDESSYDVTFEENGETTSASDRQANEDASEETWGATFADGVLQITLFGEGFTLQAVVETTESAKAPGRFTVGQPPEGTFVSVVDALAMDVFDSNGQGQIRLDTCPSGMGDKVVGAFENVVLFSEMGEGQRTLNGTFDVVVYAAVGELHCEPVESGGDGDGDGDGDGEGGYCSDFELCEEEDGLCCPYMPCVAQCNADCIFEDPDCNFGMNPAACAACAEGCLDQCNVSSSCRSALEDYFECDETYSCSEHESEDAEMSCLRQNCCTEIQTAF